MMMIPKFGYNNLNIIMNSGRHKFEHEGKTIYQWEESLDAVTLYINPPPIVVNKKLREQFAKANPKAPLPSLQVKISNQKVAIGIKGNPPYLDLKTKGLIDTSDSLWFVNDNTLEIALQKAYKGESWMGVFEGHEMANPFQKEKVNKALLLQRFQQQNPGFDFSSAQVNGNVPEARTFMGGVKHQ